MQVELLRKKMEGLSKGMLDRMEEEYGSMLSTTANSSVASSASTSKRMEFPDSSSFSTRQTYQVNFESLIYTCQQIFCIYATQLDNLISFLPVSTKHDILLVSDKVAW